MTNWKNLRFNPPNDNCDVCVKIGTNYETFQFKRYSDVSWELIKNMGPVNHLLISDDALYIILNDIK